MKTIPRVFTGLAISVVGLVSSAALAQDSYDVRRNTNFAAIRTYAFKDTAPMAPYEEKTTTYDSPIQRERTNAAIAAQLDARGLKRDDEHPDVYIITRRSYYTEYTYYGGYGWGPYYGTAYGPAYPYSGWVGWDGDVYADLRGVLTVDVVDAKEGALLWRGVENKHVHQSSKPQRRDRRVTEEVADVFKHFPATIGGVATTGER
jgi:hypothetical protein